MSAVGQRRISAWTCAACLAAVWVLIGICEGKPLNWLLGVITGIAMGISLSMNEKPPPFTPTLSLSGILFAALIFMAVRDWAAPAVAALSILGAVFFRSQWIYVKSFEISAEPQSIDSSQSSREQL